MILVLNYFSNLLIKFVLRVFEAKTSHYWRWQSTYQLLS